MQMTQVDLIKISFKELWKIRNLALVIFIIISLSALVVGWYWPRVYVSSSTVLVDEQNILQPLMEGTAVATDVKNIAKNAKQLLSGQNTKDKLLDYMSADVAGLSLEEKDQYWERMFYKTKIFSVGKGLVKIEYKSTDPIKSQKIAAFFTDLFIDESTKNKRQESQSAYDFISGQASNYHQKLRISEEALKDFRSDHLESSPGSLKTVVDRILGLQRSLEETELEISEFKIQLKNTENQLSGEAVVSAYLTEEGQLQKRIATIENQLDTLRMTYLDSYPDVIILKDQISALKLKMEDVRNNVGKKSKQTGSLNPLFQELRSQSSQYTIQLAALKTRLKATNKLLEDEKFRARGINSADAELAELTRGYEVNRDIYQRLLRQRENARVSMNIDTANQGLTLRVQEMAVVPVRSVGLRLLHIILVGFVLAIVTPFAIAYLISMLDGNIRSKIVLQSFVSVPVLGSVPVYKTKSELRLNTIWLSRAVPCLICVLVAYGYVAWLRLIVQGS
jgi:polysaccharide chain length determinant protein (PEP-CTERM system associated)